MDQRLPAAFDSLSQFAFHAAERAWTGLGHFFLCQSILALAWTQIYVASPIPFRDVVLISMSVAGVVMGFQWALLGTRMWHYHLEYVAQLAAMWQTFTLANQGPGAEAWREIDAAIAEHWRRPGILGKLVALSGNHWTLFTAPLLLSAIHLVMLFAVVWRLGPGGPYCAIGAAVLILIGFAWVWKHCKPVLDKPIIPT